MVPVHGMHGNSRHCVLAFSAYADTHLRCRFQHCNFPDCQIHTAHAETYVSIAQRLRCHTAERDQLWRLTFPIPVLLLPTLFEPPLLQPPVLFVPLLGSLQAVKLVCGAGRGALTCTENLTLLHSSCPGKLLL